MIEEVDRLSKTVGDRDMFSNLSVTLPYNGISGMFGPNGVGKTACFRCLPALGSLTPVRSGLTRRHRLLTSTGPAPTSIPNRIAGEVVAGSDDVLHIGPVQTPSRAYIAAFGLKGPDQQMPARLFSGGGTESTHLALTLKQGGNVLLRDEPTNDLDTETPASLENAIVDFSGCAVVTAHDRLFLDRIATHILAWEGSETDPVQWFWLEGNTRGL